MRHGGARAALWAMLVFGLVFYASAYWFASALPPSAVPVHHDDYSNYASGGNPWAWVWIRPLSTLLIHALAQLGPEWLIWSIRLLTVAFVALTWAVLCELARPTRYWPVLLLFALACFATPVIAEYARYTGMITHLLSGCLGMAAALALLREAARPRRGWLACSLLLLLLSVLAKEDFVVLYAVSILYATTRPGPRRRAILGWGGGGLAVSALFIAGAKFMAASSFLGVSDAAAPYYVDATPFGVAHTMWRYLTGAGHPAMAVHGRLVAALFVFSLLAALALLLRQRSLPKSAYLLAATLSVMLPYSVLPNHVNAYYEPIWLPLLIASCYVALTELAAQFPGAGARTASRRSVLALLVVALVLSGYDYAKRHGIAAWYDEVGAANGRVLQALRSQQERINQAGNVCIVGANAFSPWYMHGGDYLGNVMGLHAKWYVVVDPASPLHAGMALGAAASGGRTVLLDDAARAPVPCLSINLEPAK